MVHEYVDGVRNGTLHAPWKDDVWTRERREEEQDREDLSTSEQSVKVGDIIIIKDVVRFVTSRYTGPFICTLPTRLILGATPIVLVLSFKMVLFNKVTW